MCRIGTKHSEDTGAGWIALDCKNEWKTCQCAQSPCAHPDWKRDPGLVDFRCCERAVSVPATPHLTDLWCRNCPLLETIQSMPQLQTLVCINCPRLSSIAGFGGLRELIVEQCPRIDAVPSADDLKYVTCHGCPVASIPSYPKLRSLEYSYGPLASIPDLPALTSLDLTNCAITLIPVLKQLEGFGLDKCLRVAHIPSLPELRRMRCHGNSWLRSISASPKLLSTMIVVSGSPLAYIARALRRRGVSSSTFAAKVAALLARARRRITVRHELRRVLTHPAFVGPVIDIVARLL